MTIPSQDKKSFSVAVVVCTLDRPAATRWLVSYLDQLVPNFPFDCSLSLVLVESSQELTAVDTPNHIDFHHVKSRRGLPHQRNVGVGYVKSALPDSQVLVFLDDDVIPTFSFFESALTVSRRNQTEIIGAIDILEQFNWQMELAEKVGWVPKPGTISRSGFATAPRAKANRQNLDWVAGFAFAMNPSIFENFKFPEEVLFFGEDVLFGLNLGREVQINIPESAVVFHAPFAIKDRSEAEDQKHRYLLAHRIVRTRTPEGFSPWLFWLRVLIELLVEAIPALVDRKLRLRFQGRVQAILELLSKSANQGGYFSD
jgi:GT2 family glycosyltransferase